MLMQRTRCCPPDSVCDQLSDDVVGCCPDGDSCVNLDQVHVLTYTSTTDFTSASTTTTSSTTSRPTTTTTTTQGGGGGGIIIIITTITNGGSVTTSTTTRTVKTTPTGACYTLTMNGAPLPTLFPGYCPQGVLIVQAAGERHEAPALRWIVSVCSAVVAVIYL
jgi:hypothetical protein